MLFDPKEIPQVDMDFMNKTHEEEINLINTIHQHIEDYNGSNDDNKKIDTLYEEWIEHTIAHFNAEETKMKDMKFPPYLAHKGEHDKALQDMKNVFDSWKKERDINMLKHYINIITPQWFMMHVTSMDTVTASFFATGVSPCSLH